METQTQGPDVAIGQASVMFRWSLQSWWRAFTERDQRAEADALDDVRRYALALANAICAAPHEDVRTRQLAPDVSEWARGGGALARAHGATGTTFVGDAKPSNRSE